MPVYDFQCSTCQHADIEVMPMQKAVSVGESITCPHCGKPTYRRLISLPHTDLKEFHTPIEMYSIALNSDEEIVAFKRRCPDVDVSMDQDDPMYGVPVARSRKQKLAALGQAGFVENN